MRVTQIIDAAGISAGTFYRLFGGKDAVLEELVTELSDRMGQAIEERRRPPRDDPVEDLRDWVTCVVDVGQHGLGEWGPQLRRLVRLGLPPALQRVRDLHEAVSHEFVLPILQRGIESGVFRSSDADATARLVMATVDQATLIGRPTPAECADFVVGAVTQGEA